MLEQTLGAYRVKRELGKGGMGKVYLAEVEEEVLGLTPGDRVAIKVIHSHLLAQRGFFKRFLREAQVGKKVRHPHVARTLDVDATMLGESQVNYLVMEYVPGKTLRQVLKEQGTLTDARVRELGRQLVDGLSAIHSAGIVHRDLKPENLIVGTDQRIRIMDLGVARLLDTSQNLTAEGQFAGSVLYAAPEQIVGDKVTPAADLYSAGVILYELTTGENPFLRDDFAAVVHAHLEVVPSPARRLNPRVSRFLSLLLDDLLRKCPEDRLQPAAQILDILRKQEGSPWWKDRCRHPTIVGTVTGSGERRVPSSLVMLRGALGEAIRGNGCTLVVEVDTSIGKDQLLQTFLDELEDKDVHVLRGVSARRDAPNPLCSAVIEELGSGNLARKLGPILSLPPGNLRAFVRMLKEGGPLLGNEDIEAGQIDAGFGAIARSLAGEMPVVWIVDDVDRAGGDTLRVLRSMAQELQKDQVLLIATTAEGLPEEELAHLGKLGRFHLLSVTPVPTGPKPSRVTAAVGQTTERKVSWRFAGLILLLTVLLLIPVFSGPLVHYLVKIRRLDEARVVHQLLGPAMLHGEEARHTLARELVLRARSRKSEGRYREAHQDLAAALDLRPDDADILKLLKEVTLLLEPGRAD